MRHMGHKLNGYYHNFFVKHKWYRIFNSLLVLLVLVLTSLPLSLPVAEAAYQHHKVSQFAYQQKNGYWVQVSVPSQYKINAVHTVLLKNKDVLIVAGSGNNQDFFDNGTFKSLLFDPATMTFTNIPTPYDMFCGGHVELPNGNILIAGGTSKYENLTPKTVGGAMELHNTSTTSTHTYPKGTIFIGPDGQTEFKTAFAVTVPPSALVTEANGTTQFTDSEADVWVDEYNPSGGPATVQFNTQGARYELKNATAADSHFFGIGSAMNLSKQDFRGTKDAYIFNVTTLKYQKVNSMNYARWYPTLVKMGNGMVMSISGLDQAGQILNGQNEIFNPTTNTWSDGPNHTFPTYPAVFQTTEPGVLFFTGSNSGYGPNIPSWRRPGLWNVVTDTYIDLPALPDNDNMSETSGSVLLAPAQQQKYMVLGGGGVGDSEKSTNKTETIKPLSKDPMWMPGPNLAHDTRYPIVVTLPDDTELVTGGSSGYRGDHQSDNRDTRIYHPTTNTLSMAANSLTGRDYHSEGLLLPDGSVLTLGGNPLFSDKADKTPAPFNQEIDLFFPNYFYTGTTRPTIVSAPEVMKLGTTVSVSVKSTSPVTKLRLISLSSVTHVTNVDQRSVALPFTSDGHGNLTAQVPSNTNLLIPGYYMLFATNAKGVPTTSTMVDVP